MTEDQKPTKITVELPDGEKLYFLGYDYSLQSETEVVRAKDDRNPDVIAFARWREMSIHLKDAHQIIKLGK